MIDVYLPASVFLRAFHGQHLSKFLPTEHTEGHGNVKSRKGFVDMLRLKMVEAQRKEPVEVLHENPGGYGQGKRENVIEWEVFNSSDF